MARGMGSLVSLVACRATCTGCELYAESEGNRTFDGESVICWKCFWTLKDYSPSGKMRRGEWDEALFNYSTRRWDAA